MEVLELINDPLNMMVTDRIHPNMAGALRMADEVAAVLETLADGNLESLADGRQ